MKASEHDGKKMTDLWKVVLEARCKGAIGTFQNRFFIVRAKDKTHAFEYAIEDAEMEGMEPRNCISAERMP